ncbi:MAG: MerR family transcriptional regulator [Treponema sp.]|nr:MerR family transcriptional regulator [Treponema sp.]
MKTYSIGEVEELSGVKAHVLRYWEEVIPGFVPQKDVGGRRIYTFHEIELVQRLKYLIYEKKFTIEGARNQLIQDADARNENFELMNQIHSLKAELTELYLYAKKIKV